MCVCVCVCVCVIYKKIHYRQRVFRAFSQHRKWFQIFLPTSNNSIKYLSYVYREIKK